MLTPGTPRGDSSGPRVLVGYDGSPGAAEAIAVGARLFPGATAWIAYLWSPPFASHELFQQLRRQARSLDELSDLIEQEGGAEAQRLAASGVALALAAGWAGESVVRRSFGGEGFEMAALAEELDADLILVGSRGLGGTRAALGSVADLIVHYSPRPALVVPHPLASSEYETLATGPIVVGWDGSAGANAALDVAGELFPERQLVAAEVLAEGDASLWPPDPARPRATAVRLPLRRATGAGRAVAAQLDAYAREHSAAAIVVGSRGHSALREMLLGSVAKATLHNVRRPVVVVRNPR